MMNFDRDEMETVLSVCQNEIARLNKRLDGLDPVLDQVDHDFVGDRIAILHGTVSKLLDELMNVEV
jgi:hypothetical protein